MTTRTVTTTEVSIQDEPLARVHLVATLVDPVHLLPMRNFFSGKSIQPDVRVTAVSDDDGMIVVELVRNDVMSLDSRYLIETWIEREDCTRTPRRRHVIYIDDGIGDVPLDDLTPSTDHTGGETPSDPSDRQRPTLRIWLVGTASTDNSAPSAIPADVARNHMATFTITLAADGFLAIAQTASIRPDIMMIVIGSLGNEFPSDWTLRARHFQRMQRQKAK